MSALSIPSLSVNTTNGELNLSDLKGKNIVLYFYPKDNTPGCTIETKAFRDAHDEFAKKNAVIFGVSRDSLTSHDKFKTKCELPFELISDPDEQLCNHFGVMGEKSMFGKKYMGLIRSTFLIGPDGNVIKEWRKVKIKGHVAEVLDSL